MKVGDGELSAAADGGAAAASALELVVRPRAVHGHGHGRVATARAAPGLPDHLRLDAPRAFLGGGALALAGRRLLLVRAGLLGRLLDQIIECHVHVHVVRSVGCLMRPERVKL